MCVLRGQFIGTGSLFVTCRLQRLTLGGQVYKQAPLSMEPSCRSPLFISETSSLSDHEAWFSYAGWTEAFRALPASIPPGLGLQTYITSPASCMSSGDLNSYHHVCGTLTLRTEHSSQPGLFLLLRMILHPESSNSPASASWEYGLLAAPTSLAFKPQQ